MNAFRLWLSAMRPRTLFLAVAGVITGVGLAAADGHFSLPVALLTLLTALLLQVLSNLANDYGDSRHGVDGAARTGPQRAVQSGGVTLQEMLRATILSALLAAGSGLALLWVALGQTGLLLALSMLVLGGFAIWAAIAYTASAKPYGYEGYGDMAVLVFFGIVAVGGSYFLQAGSISWTVLLPALAAGLLSVGVLNINNVRDISGDAASGKRTLPVRIGGHAARHYHAVLLYGAPLLSAAYVLLEFRSAWQFLFLLAVPLLVRNVRGVATTDGAALNPLLGKLARAALVYSVLFVIGQLV